MRRWFEGDVLGIIGRWFEVAVLDRAVGYVRWWDFSKDAVG